MRKTETPRIFHRIWLDEPLPEKFEPMWDKWRDYHPGWEVRTWTDSKEVRKWIVNKEAWDKILAGAETEPERRNDFIYGDLPDILRYELMWRYGGVYVDFDFEPLQSFEPLLNIGPFAAWESDQYLCCALMGGPPRHLAYKMVLNAIPDHVTKRWNQRANDRTGPRVLTNAWRHRTDVTRFPPSTFYPVAWDDRKSLGGPYPEESFAVHYWNAGWIPPRDKAKFGPPGNWEDEEPESEPEPEPKAARLLIPATDVRMRKEHGGVSIIIPFRPDKSFRVALWDWLHQFYTHEFPDAELIVGKDMGKPFSRAAAVNDGVARSHGYFLVILDSDCLLDPDVIRNCVGRIASSFTPIWFVPFKVSGHMTEAATAKLLKLPPVLQSVDSVRDTKFETTITMPHGIASILSRVAFNKAGGFDERFRGWGSEDVSFIRAVDTLYTQYTRTSNTVLHLWHPRERRGYIKNLWVGQDPLDSTNSDLSKAYQAAARNKVKMQNLIAGRDQ